ncbi:carbohydrate ABC transporter permease [Facklamia miroungae]|uniref:sn-glycerol 3-phosphate transport system permease protein n=1 Tax=Facklamia miroungae TaxID=120956 RepID=A0A1G7SS97_9LACT|nr:carbohydrate ABC transporter permease [Facklamia miroungae]NKZ29558.1 carbohydrate ABC transporter permease [Facklamia miroungae]SDG25893.1 sn-glycerol 3-phosphate transport system permease protein [Facklamia miroungae]
MAELIKENKKNTVKKRREPITVWSIVRLLINIVMLLIVLSPLLYGLMMSVKPSGELYDPESVWFPKNPTLTNFLDVFEMAPIGTYIRNSMIVAVAITLSQLITSVLAAFAFRFLKFKGKGLLYALILSTMMIPGEAVIISQFLMVSSWGWNDSLYVLIIPFIISAFNIFLCVQALQNFPYEVYEAAKVDGCTDLRFVLTILMPLIKPTLGAMSVQSFLSGWNMYMWPLLVTNNDQNRTVQIGISMLNSVDSQSLVLMVAGVMICMIPSLLIFIVGSRNMVKGLTAGAVKG